MHWFLLVWLNAVRNMTRREFKRMRSERKEPKSEDHQIKAMIWVFVVFVVIDNFEGRLCWLRAKRPSEIYFDKMSFIWNKPKENLAECNLDESKWAFQLVFKLQNASICLNNVYSLNAIFHFVPSDTWQKWAEKANSMEMTWRPLITCFNWNHKGNCFLPDLYKRIVSNLL